MDLFDRIDAEWDEFKAKARQKWYKLQETDWNDIEREVEGRWDRFTNKVNHYYDQTVEEIKDEAEDLFDPVDDNEHEDYDDVVTTS